MTGADEVSKRFDEFIDQVSAADTATQLEQAIRAGDKLMLISRAYKPGIDHLISQRKHHIAVNEPYLKAFGHTG